MAVSVSTSVMIASNCSIEARLSTLTWSEAMTSDDDDNKNNGVTVGVTIRVYEGSLESLDKNTSKQQQKCNGRVIELPTTLPHRRSGDLISHG